jgi:hypothetical protein
VYVPSRLNLVASSDHHLPSIVVVVAVDAEVMVVGIELPKQHILICRTCAEVDVPIVEIAVAAVGNDVVLLPNFLLNRYLVLEVQWVVYARTLRC